MFKNTECDVCPNGTFSSIQNSSTCSNCTQCIGTQVMIQKCNITRDTLCERNREENGKQDLLDTVMLSVVITIDIVLLILWVIHACRHRRKERNDGETRSLINQSPAIEKGMTEIEISDNSLQAQRQETNENVDSTFEGPKHSQERTENADISFQGSDHSQTTNGNPDSSLQVFENNLKEIYRIMLSRHTDVIFGEPYVKFNMTSKNRQQSHPEMVKHIFHVNENVFKRICVIGEAGTGKTTLCRYLLHAYCSSNAQENDQFSLSKKFAWIFFISLRHFHSKSNVLDMIKCRYFQNCEHFLPQIDKTGENALVILDGLDDWTMFQVSEEGKIPPLNLSNLDDFQNFTVLMTTTQEAWNTLKSSESKLTFDREIEMKNITRRAATDFKRAEVSKWKIDEEDEPDIVDERIPKHPLLLKQYLRLYCKDRVPNEPLCNIFGKIVLNWLNDEKYTDKTERENGHPLPDCLAGGMKNHKLLFSLLGNVSYFNVTESDSNIFVLEKLREVGLSESMIESCGNTGILSRGLDSCFNCDDLTLLSFPHILYMQFFAAVYLYMVPDYVQGFLRKWDSLNKIMSLRFVVIFLSGMNSSAMSPIFKKMKSILHKESVLDGNSNSSRRFLEQSEIQSLALDCVREQKMLRADFNLEHIHICFDKLNDSRVLFLQKLIHKTTILSMNVFCRRRSSFNLKVINLNTLLETLQSRSGLQEVILNLNEEVDSSIKEILLETIEMKHDTLTTLNFRGMGCKKYLLELHYNKLEHLMNLQISDIEVNHTEKYNLMKGVAKAVTVQKLVLIKIRCNEHEQCPCPLELVENSQLQTLTLNQVQFGWVRVNSSSLTDCLETDTAVFYSPANEKFKSSTELKVMDMKNEQDIDAFSQLLPSLYQLSYLEVRKSDFGNKNVNLPKTAVSLKKIVLSTVTMTNDKLKEFINSIPLDAQDIICEFNDIKQLISKEDICERFIVARYEECVPDGKNVTFKYKE